MQLKPLVRLLVHVSITFSMAATQHIPYCWAAVKQPSLENLINRSAIILVGTVKDLQSSWQQDKTITTKVIIAPQEFLKNYTDAEEIIVEVIGGVSGEIRLDVSTEPRFEKGERVLLFLKELDRQNNLYRPVKGLQGKYTITQDNIILENNLGLSEFKTQIKAYIGGV